MKRIILCSDGTGNKGGTGRDTNVWRIYSTVDLHPAQSPRQIAFYDDGVGTQNFKLFKLLGGAFGIGLSRNIRQLYEALAKNYEPGDEIHIFGFSRGAYTARVLAALICQCGVLKVENDWTEGTIRARVREALRHHRDRYRKPLITGWLRRLYSWLGNTCDTPEAYRTGLSHDKTWDPEGRKKLITFLGVWDTVSAIGTPIAGMDWFINTLLYRIEFPDLTVHHRVAKARHALAIDDERATFHPKMWDELGTRDNMKLRRTEERFADMTDPDIRQIWFAGVHSNVGGGYPKQGLAYPSLTWIMQESGLRFRSRAIENAIGNINPNDKLYDSRAGFAAYYRYKPRDIAQFSKDNTGQAALIDITVVERADHSTEEYAPGNLPFDFELVDASGTRASSRSGTSDVIRKAFSDLTPAEKTSMMDVGRGWVTMRRGLHALFVTTTVGIASVAYFPAAAGKIASYMPVGTITLDQSAQAAAPAGWILRAMESVVPAGLASGFRTLDVFFGNFPWAFWALLGWIALLYLFRILLHRNSEGAYGAFWSKVRARLRTG